MIRLGTDDRGTIKGAGWHCELCLWIADRAGCFKLAGEWLRERGRARA